VALAAAGDHQHAAVATGLGRGEKAVKASMRLLLREAVQVEPGIDRVEPAAETEPGAPVKVDRAARVQPLGGAQECRRPRRRGRR
jgi:hypothetical protein